MIFTSATQLKDWIKNKAKQSGAPANLLLRNDLLHALRVKAEERGSL